MVKYKGKETEQLSEPYSALFIKTQCHCIIAVLSQQYDSDNCIVNQYPEITAYNISI